MKVLSAGFNLKVFAVTFFIVLSLIVGISGCGNSVTRGDTDTPEGTGETTDPVTSEEAIDVMTQVLKERGLVVPSESEDNNPQKSNPLKYEDYMTTDLSEKDERRVHFDIGPDGHIIPTAAWRDANPNVCADQNRFMKSAVKRLQFKMFAFPDGYDVFVQYIDVESGKIEHQHEGEGETLKEVVSIAWDKLTVQIHPPTDACGRLKGMTLYFNSKIEDYDESGTVIEHVEAEVWVTANVEGTYNGSGPISYLEITTSEGSCTFPDGTLNVRELVFRMEGGIPTEETALDIEYQNVINGGSCADGSDHIAHWPLNFAGMHIDEWVTEDGQTWEGLIIKDWEAVPGDENILARKIYDRTQIWEEAGGRLVEKTTIEIRK